MFVMLLLLDTVLGSIRLWDLGSGRRQKHWQDKCLPIADANLSTHQSVLSITFLPQRQEKQYLLAAYGWSGELRTFLVCWYYGVPLCSVSIVKKVVDGDLQDCDKKRTLCLLKSVSTSSLGRQLSFHDPFNQTPKLPPIGGAVPAHSLECQVTLCLYSVLVIDAICI